MIAWFLAWRCYTSGATFVLKHFDRDLNDYLRDVGISWGMAYH